MSLIGKTVKFTMSNGLSVFSKVIGEQEGGIVVINENGSEVALYNDEYELVSIDKDSE